MSKKSSLSKVDFNSSPSDTQIDQRINSLEFRDQEKEQINQYLENISEENTNKNSKKISSQICEKVEESICNKIMMRQLHINNQVNEINLSYSQNSHVNPNEQIEKNIKEQKLKDQLRTKQALEQKMKQIDQDINRIQTEMTPSSKKNQQEKQLTEEEKKQKMEFLKEKVKDRKERDKRRQQRLIEDEEKQKEEQETKKIQEQQERQHKEIQKKKELEQKMEEIKKSIKDREEKQKLENQELKKIKQQKPLFEKMIEIGEKIDHESLEIKKKRLAEIRDFHKPIDPSELKEHEKKFFTNLRALSEKNVSKKEKFEYKRPFVSEAYKRIEEERKLLLEKLKHPEEEEKNKGPNILEKIQEFSKSSVKKPKIDPLKQSEMQKIIESIKHKPNYKWFSEKKRDKSLSLPTASDKIEVKNSEQSESQTQNMADISPRKLGNTYLNRLKEQRLRVSSTTSNPYSASVHADNTQEAQNTPIIKKSKQKKFSEQQFANILKKGETTGSNQGSNSPQILPVKVDYLKELRLKNKNHKKNASELDRIINSKQDMNSSLKTEYLMKHAEKLEQQAQRKEQLLRAKGNYSGDNSENNLDNEILDTYISAIKTKFQILEQHQ